LAAELHRHPPDVFFTPAHVIPFSYRGRSVATVHDLGYTVFPEAHTRRQRAYLAWSTSHNARRSRIVLADSRATRDDLIRVVGVDSQKIAVVYPGLDPELARVEDSAEIDRVCARYNITHPYLLHIGTVQPRKNLQRLIAAFASVADQIPHQLVLAGKAGWLAAPIHDAIAHLPPALQQRIVLPGFTADEDKAALLSGATALLYPSLYEGFGFPVVEAQQCGVPVLCADSSSLPEVAGTSALLIDPYDEEALAVGIVRIINDDVLRDRLIAAGEQNLVRFDWGVAAEQLLDLLELAAER
jgi:glycosyltransferase involved in cell wall biosynthesis